MRRSSVLALASVFAALGCSSGDPVTPTDVPLATDTPPADAPVVPDAPPADVPVVTDTPTQPDAPAPTDVSGCATGQAMCGASCVDLMTDVAHCGMCSRACAMGENCTAGACVPAVSCVAPQTNCAGECVNLQTELRHCGMCGRSCVTGEACVAGVCGMAVVCPSGQTDCAGSCVDTTTSALHCGGCGMPCLDTEACEMGTCNPRMCPTGQQRCGAVCVSTQSDGANCGMCGRACSATETCTAGACVPLCPAPRLSCTVGTSTVCTNPMTDNANCGRCANACPAGQSCVAGVCGCDAGQTLCGGTCVSAQTDAANCGMCGRRCAASQSCTAGVCVCPTGRTLCGAECVNTMTDLAHCGRCTNACVAPSSCSAGACNSLCAMGTTSCGGRCINPVTDPTNCGACGVACGAGTRCVLSACRPLNDDRAGATPIALGASETTVTGNTTNATQDGPTPCGCTGGGNLWYRFSLATTEVVYLDTAGSAFDTSLFITDAGGTPVAAQPATGIGIAGLCNDDAGCPTDPGTGFTSTFQSVSYGILGAGTYYVAVGGCGLGAFNLHIQHTPTNAGTNFVTARLFGAGNVTGAVPLASTTTGSCGGAGSGEDVRWFVTCGGAMRPAFFSLCTSDTGSFTRRIGTTYLDPSVYIRSGLSNAETVCNDDGGSMGGTACAGNAFPAPITPSDTVPYGSRINNVTLPRGLHTVFVDERVRAAGVSAQMAYNLRYSVQ